MNLNSEDSKLSRMGIAVITALVIGSVMILAVLCAMRKEETPTADGREYVKEYRSAELIDFDYGGYLCFIA